MDPLVNYEYQAPPQQYQQKRYQNPNQPPAVTAGREQVVPQSTLPATPRMMRSLSGGLKNTSGDHNNQDNAVGEREGEMTPKQTEKYHQYTSSTNYQTDASHSRNSSLNQYQNPKRVASVSHSRTPSVGRHPQPPPTPPTWNSQFPNKQQQQPQVTSPQRKQELLPPAAISSPSSKTSSGNAQSSNKANHSPQPQTQQQNQGNEHSHHHHSHHHNQQQLLQQQQFHRKSIGDWDFIKTIGAGSMGKVKLAQHNSTGEICAVKIVPRAAKLFQRAHANDPPILNAQAAAQRQKEFEKEVTRDKRTIREGALGRLLFHPFICRLYEMVPMTNHYYMLFEYVEGGQMLDYIVSHGSLKEKNARKFARGIALALEYCHNNNVVHRDLKIENIMINSKGDIKIIDFGLSNLYSPKSLLKTYCGSLYFAAPELLSAKPYTGPEVDVWSFGVVLYVLVCGKVPFDDQSVSVLHEKIKRGNVEYPGFLSKECISLLSRMLVVDPTKRATLFEVIQHPWMNRGYDFTQPCYIPKRKPLELPLDPEIIKSIASFDIGTVQSITEELASILTSVEYQMSCENWYKITEQGRQYASAPNAHILPDPTGGFHPLISIYYLVYEMKMRKKAKEHSVKVQLEQSQVADKSRQTSQQPVTHTPVQSEILLFGNTQNKQQQNLPNIPFPEQAHTLMSPTTFHKGSPSPQREEKQQSIPEQQPQSPRDSTTNPDTLDPNGGKSAGLNSLFRRLSSKKYKNPSSSPNRNAASPSPSDHNVAPPPVPKVSIVPDSQEHILSPSSNNSYKVDPMVRRGVSMKVTAKERSSSSKVDLHASTSNTSGQKADVPKQTPSTHNRSSSTSTNNAGNKYRGYVPEQYLPPLPNINPNTNTLVPPSAESSTPVKPVGTEGRKLHPTARAKSVGGHVRKESYSRSRAQKQSHPPLPNTFASQNSDEVVGEGSARDDGFFDDVTLDEVDYQEIPQLSEEQIIDQFNHAKQNSMPSIEYPKTLFLKGFFSVQTTSTKPLPVIRYNIINVLSKLGVKFQEVKGGFVCAHAPSLQNKPTNPDDISTNTSTMIDSQHDEKDTEETTEEQKLYGDAFKSTSSSIEKSVEVPPRVKTPEPMPLETQVKSPKRQASLHVNTQSLSPPTNTGKTHRASNSVGGHRRKFSIGNSLLGSYRKKNGSQVMMPPNTPATAKLNKLIYGAEGDEIEDDEEDETSKQFTEDDSVDSLNGLMIGGGSDMLISSTVEHRAKHQHSPSTGNTNNAKRSPLKFEIHIVKVPLVGLYGVQFKKLLGNTWNYKTLASQILNELNL